MFNRNCCRQNYGMQNYGGQGCCQRQTQPVIEPTINKCIQKDFYHEVPHVCPIHTHVVNRHIYNHTYTPQYTCSEENQVVNNDCGKCSGFANR